MKNLAVAALLMALPQNPSSATSVSAFNWPAGTAALVDTEYVRELDDGIATQQLTLLHMTHRMRVSSHPEGVLVEFDNQKAIAAAGDVTDALGALLPWWVPRLIVGPGGALLRIEQTERVQELVERMYEPLATTLGAQSPSALRDVLTMMASGAGLRSMAQDDWNHLVGKWIAAPLDPDVLESTAVSMLVRGEPLRSKLQQRMIDRASCTREDAVVECATFELRSTVEPESLLVLQSYLTSGGGPSTMRIVSSERVDRVTLEIGTMLPHEAILTRTTQSTTEVNGRTVSTQNLQRRRVRFTYVKAQ